MACECTLCQARSLNCHPLEVYFAGRFEAELVGVNPDLPIYVYENYARDAKDEAGRKFALQAVRDYGKKFEYKEVIVQSKHSLRFLLPVVKLFCRFFGTIHSHLGKIEKMLSPQTKWERVDDQ